MKISDLFVEVGFKFDSIKLREVSKLIGDLNISSIVGATSLVALGTEIKNLIDSSSQLSSNLLTLQANTGINPQFAQQFEATADALGSSKEAADGLINSLSKIRQSIKFGGAVPRGLALMGINYQDIMGPEENLIAKINKLLSQKPALNTPAQKEAWASFISSINADLGATPDLLKALSDPQLFDKMKGFLYLSQSQIQDNQKATFEWREAVHNVNLEFMEMADKLLPKITEILKSFNQNGGLQAVANVLKGVGDEIYKAALALGIIKNYGETALLNIGSFGSKPLLALSNAHNQLSHAAAMPPMSLGQMIVAMKSALTPDKTSKSVTIQTGPITIMANNPNEFTQKFDDHFKKYMSLASSQFTLGTV